MGYGTGLFVRRPGPHLSGLGSSPLPSSNQVAGNPAGQAAFFGGRPGRPWGRSVPPRLLDALRLSNRHPPPQEKGRGEPPAAPLFSFAPARKDDSWLTPYFFFVYACFRWYWVVYLRSGKKTWISDYLSISVYRTPLWNRLHPQFQQPARRGSPGRLSRHSAISSSGPAIEGRIPYHAAGLHVHNQFMRVIRSGSPSTIVRLVNRAFRLKDFKGFRINKSTFQFFPAVYVLAARRNPEGSQKHCADKKR